MTHTFQYLQAQPCSKETMPQIQLGQLIWLNAILILWVAILTLYYSLHLTDRIIELTINLAKAPVAQAWMVALGHSKVTVTRDSSNNAQTQSLLFQLITNNISNANWNPSDLDCWRTHSRRPRLSQVAGKLSSATDMRRQRRTGLCE